MGVTVEMSPNTSRSIKPSYMKELQQDSKP